MIDYGRVCGYNKIIIKQMIDQAKKKKIAEDSGKEVVWYIQ